MKIIVLQELITSGICRTYVVNDDYVLTQAALNDIKKKGYVIKIFNAMPGNPEQEILDYIGEWDW